MVGVAQTQTVSNPYPCRCERILGFSFHRQTLSTMLKWFGLRAFHVFSNCPTPLAPTQTLVVPAWWSVHANAISASVSPLSAASLFSSRGCAKSSGVSLSCVKLLFFGHSREFCHAVEICQCRDPCRVAPCRPMFITSLPMVCLDRNGVHKTSPRSPSACVDGFVRGWP